MSTSISTEVLNENNVNNDVFGQLSAEFNIDDFLKRYQDVKLDIEENYAVLKACTSRLNKNYSYNISGYPSPRPLATSIKILDSELWKEVLESRNLFTLMSDVEAKKWTDIFEVNDVPEFTKDNVIASIKDIYASSSRYFAERICTALTCLSKDHLTNSKYGFGEKIIIKDIHQGFSAKIKYPSPISEMCSSLTELRKLVCFLSNGNLDELNNSSFISSYDLITACIKQLEDNGKSYFSIDQDNIQIKVFKVGTIHIMIKPEIADKMNYFVSVLYPNQLPSKITKKTYFKGNMEKQFLNVTPIRKDFYEALKELSAKDRFFLRKMNFECADGEYIYTLQVDKRKKLVNSGDLLEFNELVIKLGGIPVKRKPDMYTYTFAFARLDKIIDQIILNGGLDNKQDYQQYYTKEELSLDAYSVLKDGYSEVELSSFNYLEPSCGQGALLKRMPKNKSKGVDISLINTAILKTQGYDVQCADFVEYALSTADRFNLILSNPPFTDNQAYNHTMLGYELLKEKGSIVAILPATLMGKFDFLISDNVVITESKVYKDQFDGTSVTVFILKIKRV